MSALARNIRASVVVRSLGAATTIGEVSVYVDPLPLALREARLAARLTQRELAAKAEVSCSYVAMLESGSRKRAHPKIMLRLAGALGVGLFDLTTLTSTF